MFLKSSTWGLSKGIMLAFLHRTAANLRQWTFCSTYDGATTDAGADAARALCVGSWRDQPSEHITAWGLNWVQYCFLSRLTLSIWQCLILNVVAVWWPLFGSLMLLVLFMSCTASACPGRCPLDQCFQNRPKFATSPSTFRTQWIRATWRHKGVKTIWSTASHHKGRGNMMHHACCVMNTTARV